MLWAIIGSFLGAFVTTYIIRKHREKAAAQNEATARLRAEYGLDGSQAAGSVGGSSGTIMRFDDDKPKLDPAPLRVGDAVRVYQYADVELVNTSRAFVQYAKVGEPVTFEKNGETMQTFCGGKLIGDLKPTRLTEMIQDWKSRGDPIVSRVVSYTWTGSAGMIDLNFYRDELSRIRNRRGAFVSRLNAIDEAMADETFVGYPCTVNFDDERGRYDVLYDGIRIGSLSKSAIDKIREDDQEPEDVTVYIDHVEETDDKPRLFVLIR